LAAQLSRLPCPEHLRLWPRFRIGGSAGNASESRPGPREDQGGRSRRPDAAAHPIISSVRVTPPYPPPKRAFGRTPVSRRAIGAGERTPSIPLKRRGLWGNSRLCDIFLPKEETSAMIFGYETPIHQSSATAPRNGVTGRWRIGDLGGFRGGRKILFESAVTP
jgi:hypothetical protein